MLEERFVKDIDYIAKKTHPVRLRETRQPHLQNKVPVSLAAIWGKYGVASWADGAFQTCDPPSLENAIYSALDGLLTPHDVVPFVISAFGTVKAWHNKYGVFDIHFPFGRIVLSDAPETLLEKNPGDVNFISRFPTGTRDFPLVDGFIAVRNALGRLEENEVYGFVPAIALGGTPEPANAKRLKADVHLDLLAQMRRFDLLYFTPSGYQRIE